MTHSAGIGPSTPTPPVPPPSSAHLEAQCPTAVRIEGVEQEVKTERHVEDDGTVVTTVVTTSRYSGKNRRTDPMTSSELQIRLRPSDPIQLTKVLETCSIILPLYSLLSLHSHINSAISEALTVLPLVICN